MFIYIYKYKCKFVGILQRPIVKNIYVYVNKVKTLGNSNLNLNNYTCFFFDKQMDDNNGNSR